MLFKNINFVHIYTKKSKYNGLINDNISLKVSLHHKLCPKHTKKVTKVREITCTVIQIII